jgi:hypothetical protein
MRLFTKESFLAIGQHHGSIHALFSAPLQMTEIWRAPCQEYYDARDHDRQGGHADIQDDDIIVGVVVSVLNDASDDANDNVDAIIC